VAALRGGVACGMEKGAGVMRYQRVLGQAGATLVLTAIAGMKDGAKPAEARRVEIEMKWASFVAPNRAARRREAKKRRAK
jgi:hypothetical protein